MFEKTLMKWREPKIKGVLTLNNIIWLIGLICLVSLLFGFLVHNGTGRFSVSVWLQALAFMSTALVAVCIQPLRPGFQIRLTKTGIVRKMSRRNQKTAYADIDCCYLYRDCTCSIVRDVATVKVHDRRSADPKFTNFQVILKGEHLEHGEREVSFRSLKCVTHFAVPSHVDLEAVLKILREHNVRVVEPDLSSQVKSADKPA